MNLMNRNATHMFNCSASPNPANGWRSFTYFSFYFINANGAGSEKV